MDSDCTNPIKTKKGAKILSKEKYLLNFPEAILLKGILYLTSICFSGPDEVPTNKNFALGNSFCIFCCTATSGITGPPVPPPTKRLSSSCLGYIYF